MTFRRRLPQLNIVVVGQRNAIFICIFRTKIEGNYVSSSHFKSCRRTTYPLATSIDFKSKICDLHIQFDLILLELLLFLITKLTTIELTKFILLQHRQSAPLFSINAINHHSVLTTRYSHFPSYKCRLKRAKWNTFKLEQYTSRFFFFKYSSYDPSIIPHFIVSTNTITSRHHYTSQFLSRSAKVFDPPKWELIHIMRKPRLFWSANTTCKQEDTTWPWRELYSPSIKSHYTE